MNKSILLPVLISLAGCGAGSVFTSEPVPEPPTPETKTIVIPPPDTPDYYITNDPQCPDDMVTINNMCRVTIDRYCILHDYRPEPCFNLDTDRHCSHRINRRRCQELLVEGI